MNKSNCISSVILLVEDDPDDILITKRAFKESSTISTLYIVRNGVDAIKFVFKKDEYRDAPTPSIILLDINMPKMDGFQVLKELKANKMTRKIPVIMLTTSSRDNDVEKAYKNGCNNYIQKPVSYEKFIKTLHELQDYWLNKSKIPI
jgi:CheY-like chemotaxis protein